MEIQNSIEITSDEKEEIYKNTLLIFSASVVLSIVSGVLGGGLAVGLMVTLSTIPISASLERLRGNNSIVNKIDKFLTDYINSSD